MMCYGKNFIFLEEKWIDQPWQMFWSNITELLTHFLLKLIQTNGVMKNVETVMLSRAPSTILMFVKYDNNALILKVKSNI